MKRVLIVGLLAAVVAVSVGCESAQTREWTVKAAIVETGIVAHSEFWAEGVEAMTPAQIEAFGRARVALYEAYGQQLKDALEELKKD